MKKSIQKSFSLAGVFLLGLSILLYIALEVSSRWEQARTPGEKNLGVAVLGMTFGIPMLISAATGLLCLLISGLAFIYSRFLQRPSRRPTT